MYELHNPTRKSCFFSNLVCHRNISSWFCVPMIRCVAMPVVFVMCSHHNLCYIKLYLEGYVVKRCQTMLLTSQKQPLSLNMHLHTHSKLISLLQLSRLFFFFLNLDRSLLYFPDQDTKKSLETTLDINQVTWSFPPESVVRIALDE